MLTKNKCSISRSYHKVCIMVKKVSLLRLNSYPYNTKRTPTLVGRNSMYQIKRKITQKSLTEKSGEIRLM